MSPPAQCATAAARSIRHACSGGLFTESILLYLLTDHVTLVGLEGYDVHGHVCMRSVTFSHLLMHCKRQLHRLQGQLRTRDTITVVLPIEPVNMPSQAFGTPIGVVVIQWFQTTVVQLV